MYLSVSIHIPILMDAVVFSFPSNSNFPNRTNGSVRFYNSRFIAATVPSHSIETQMVVFF